MQSYASPGRVITVTNSGPDAVAVRRDQPYRLGLLVGVTQAAAEVDAELNLCVEGVYEQTVALADGVAAAEAGDPVLMNVATFALVAGLTDTTDHVHFGVLAERMTRRRVALVKLTPASAAAPASGGGDGGNGGGSSGGREILVLSNTRVGPNYPANPDFAYIQSGYGYDGQDLQPQVLVAKTDGFIWPAAKSGAESKSYVRVAEAGIYRITFDMRLWNQDVASGTGIMLRVNSFNPQGLDQSNSYLTKSNGSRENQPETSAGGLEFVVHRFPAGSTNTVQKHLRGETQIYLGEGWGFWITASVFGGSGQLKTGYYDFDYADSPAQAVDACNLLMVEKVL